MLVLSRKIGESIKIGNDIEVVIKQVKGDRVRVAIEAPGHIRVMRTELGPPDEEQAE